jgi:hypothetical protein
VSSSLEDSSFLGLEKVAAIGRLKSNRHFRELPDFVFDIFFSNKHVPKYFARLDLGA